MLLPINPRIVNSEKWWKKKVEWKDDGLRNNVWWWPWRALHCINHDHKANVCHKMCVCLFLLLLMIINLSGACALAQCDCQGRTKEELPRRDDDLSWIDSRICVKYSDLLITISSSYLYTLVGISSHSFGYLFKPIQKSRFREMWLRWFENALTWFVEFIIESCRWSVVFPQ